MRAIRKVRVYLLIYNETSKICQKCILDGDYVTLEFKLKFLQKQLSEQLLIFINDLQLLLGQHNRFLLIYRKVTVLFTMDVLKVYCIHGMYIKQIENKLLQFNSIQFNSFMTKVPEFYSPAPIEAEDRDMKSQNFPNTAKQRIVIRIVMLRER